MVAATPRCGTVHAEARRSRRPDFPSPRPAHRVSGGQASRLRPPDVSPGGIQMADEEPPSPPDDTYRAITETQRLNLQRNRNGCPVNRPPSVLYIGGLEESTESRSVKTSSKTFVVRRSKTLSLLRISFVQTRGRELLPIARPTPARVSRVTTTSRRVLVVRPRCQRPSLRNEKGHHGTHNHHQSGGRRDRGRDSGPRHDRQAASGRRDDT